MLQGLLCKIKFSANRKWKQMCENVENCCNDIKFILAKNSQDILRIHDVKVFGCHDLKTFSGLI